jgi:hypothetical protein
LQDEKQTPNESLEPVGNLISRRCAKI